MQIDIQAQDFSLTDALRQHTERRLHFALSRTDDQIRRVEVRLSDINGPRGGHDKRCRLRLVMSGMSDLMIEDIDTDLYAAINRATARAGRSLVRRLKRQSPRGRRASDIALESSDFAASGAQ